MKIILSILVTIFIVLNVAGKEHMSKSRYINLMEKILSAYSNEHIESYYNKVKSDGLKEHGYPRLTANIGILLAHNKRLDLKELFVKMMDLCCQEIPKVKGAGNEFSIREIGMLILELEKKETFPQEQIENWKNHLKKVTIENCYNIYAFEETSKVNNWAAFAMTSEWMRYVLKVAPIDYNFIDKQAASQWQYVEENGMYRDPHEPMLYDFVTRGLFAMLFHFWLPR